MIGDRITGRSRSDWFRSTLRYESERKNETQDATFYCAVGGLRGIAVTSRCGRARRARRDDPAEDAQSHLQLHRPQQTFKVPKGVHAITVDARGGGTSIARPRKAEHAFGGRTQATLPVTPGESLVVMVGGDGTTGFNGGGSSGCPSSYFGLGAGASDVRERGSGLGNRILVAGGAGGNKGLRGGLGGGLIGGSGRGSIGKSGRGGTGGTQSSGGAGGAGGLNYGASGNPGKFGVCGSGGVITFPSYNIECGAGGGGGTTAAAAAAARAAASRAAA